MTAADARRFLLRAHLIDAPVPSVGGVLSHLGYVQIDPIDVCGRMHEHILRNRVAGYRQGDLERHLHGEPGNPLPVEKRAAFEHHLPSTDVLVAFPLDAWPHLAASMRERSTRRSAWLGRLTPRERDFSRRILEEVAARGPLGPWAFADGRKGRKVWGSATLAKATLQKLFFHGRLLIAGRDSNRRLYDLPERVLPHGVLSAPQATALQTQRWLAVLRLRQHRLAALTKAEAALVADLACPVEVGDGPRLFCLRTDLPLLETRACGGSREPPRLLAPLDPVIYDRRVTRQLWGFDYAWEAYVPAPKRKRGYYALPVLSGTELVGHVDLKADRQAGRLRVVSRRVAGRTATSGAVASLARFLGLR